MAERSLAPAVDHALAVLTLLAGEVEPLPATLIAERLGLPRSSVYRLLGILTDRGFVTHLEQERRYGLGLAAFELGAAYQRQESLARIARPLIRRLVEETTQTAHLAVLRGREVFYVSEERAPCRASLITDVGVRLPAVATASGRAILARLPVAQIRALYPERDALDGCLGSLAELREILRDTRARGHAVEDGCVTAGLSSIAAAVPDHAGHPVAAVAVTFAVRDTGDADREAILPAVLLTVDRIARRLRGLG